MSGYAIFIVEAVHDTKLLEEYRVSGRASVAAHGGKPRVLANSAKTVVEGEVDNVIIIEFPTLEQARVWYQSADYQAASELRKRACTCRVVLTETT